MKTPSLLFALVSFAVSVPDLLAQSTQPAPPKSTKDRILEACSYENTPLTPAVETAPTIPAIGFCSYSAEKNLAKKLAIRRRPAHDPLEKVKFFGVVKDDSFLSTVVDRVAAFDYDYRKIRGGMEYTVLGQPMTLYVHSRLVIKTSTYNSVVLTWSGRMSVAKEWKF
jgi:hypothetical protein